MNIFARQHDFFARMNKREGHLLVDKELADQVWEVWDAGEIDDQIAWLVWWLIAKRPVYARKRPLAW